jgi:nitroimidazol reductase NimA-like FMN-containing flavoprotein (pyridoxamine 5'-phosphate oxidase superfamily)
MKEMRRQDRAIGEKEALGLLSEAEYAVLSTVDENGAPYGVPLNFCVVKSCIYFHCAQEGQKIENILRNKAVSLCVVGNTEVLPGKFSTRFASAIVSGTAEEVFTLEKQLALESLLKKYSAEFLDKGKRYIVEEEGKTRVFRITIKELTGKARK